MPRLTPTQAAAWKKGRFHDSFRTLGAHVEENGTYFCVWAPDVDAVSVIGEFNDWDSKKHPLDPLEKDDPAFWHGFVKEAGSGDHYKYALRTGSKRFDKADPFGFAMEPPEPGGSATHGLSSIVVDLDYAWRDEDWMAARPRREGAASYGRPMAIYEVHPGSWRRRDDGSYLNYTELAGPLIDYVKQMGFTHVEFLPVLEHPFYASWGYQVAGYFAPTHRYGWPSDLKTLIDALHRAGIGVFLDWVPAHFATDPQALAHFNGGPLYEYADPLMQSHPDWGTNVFDYANPSVRNFLISNALFWLEEYHVDGLRFDAVASMLYRDYSRDAFSPNRLGGRENLEAGDFLRELSDVVTARCPGVALTAEEATAWPAVSGPTEDGGLGFTYKWNMGWMNDTLQFMRRHPMYRKDDFKDLTFPLVYAFSEHYTLPLSHDEVVHGKGSLWGKMPGVRSEKAANLRLLLAHQYGHPGKKLLFMGGEFGQEREWSHDRELDWELLDQRLHRSIHRWVLALNTLYTSHEALWNDEAGGFEWIDIADTKNCVVSYLRRSGERTLVFVFNFSNRSFRRYRVGLPEGGRWRVVLNSQARRFHGSGRGSKGVLKSSGTSWHWRNYSIVLALPALGVLVLEPEREMSG